MNSNKAMKRNNTARIIKKLIQAAPELNQEHIASYAKSMDVDDTITVYNSYEDYVEVVTQTREGVIHSWAGEDTIKEIGLWFIDDVTGGTQSFGLHHDIVWSQNGELSDNDPTGNEPVFDISHRAIARMKCVESNGMNNRNVYHESYEVMIYIPDPDDRNIDPLLQRIIRDFNL